jgi:formylglycine-generating enzyme required for sulfatase activity
MTGEIRRLTVTQQSLRDKQFRLKPLAIEVIEAPKGFEQRARALLANLPDLLVIKGVRVRFITPRGLELNVASLIGKTPAEIDEVAARLDALSQAAVSRVSAMEVVHIDTGTFPVKGSHLFGEKLPGADAIEMSGFFVAKYPVTVALYREFVEATGYEITGQRAEDLKALLADRSKDDHPVVSVNQADREAYTRWRSDKTRENWFILSAAQQEFIRRGSSGRTYPWGNNWRQAPYYNTNGTAPVDAWPEGKTPEGVSGLGIVWEATRSCYGDYDPEIVKDPEGPSSGNIEVRGGSAWRHTQEDFFGADRNSDVPDGRDSDVGFRLGRT